MPTAAGFWTAWFPFSVLQRWPFCWHVACVVDPFSRRVMSFEVYEKTPSSMEAQRFVASVTAEVGAAPRYVITDKGSQFDCDAFRDSCQARAIRARYASAGSLRATAIVERFIRSLKDEWLHRIRVPLRADAMRRKLGVYQAWPASHRPHQGLEGRTPQEGYDGHAPQRPSFARDEPLSMLVSFHDGRQLPIVELKRAA